MSYDPDTGEFRWKVSTGRGRNSNRAGQLAGTIQGPVGKKYLVITIFGVDYYAHRLAWFYVHGEWPKGMTDHRNLDRLDNRIGNLRPATHSQNVWNSRRHKDASNRYRGVSRFSSKRLKNPWYARISANGLVHCLGCFPTPEEAARAYDAAARRHHGEFARANF